MKVLKEKSYKVKIVAPETAEEDAAIKKIIKDVKKENPKTKFEDWTLVRPKKS